MLPTSHALPETHRAHLIRSTRKLGALLGETPLLVDEEPQRNHSPSHSVSSVSSADSRRSGRIFDPVPRSSSLGVVRANDESRSRSTPEPTNRPHLYLHLASPMRPVSVAPPTPLTPGYSPLTPVFEPEADRRKKMAKLTRTLGHNVPPELVISAPPPKRQRRGKSEVVANDYLPSPRVVPAMLAMLDPAPRGRLGSAPPSPSRSLASPTREAERMLRGSTRSSSSDGSAATSSPPRSPRSPHYVKRAHLLQPQQQQQQPRAPSPYLDTDADASGSETAETEGTEEAHAHPSTTSRSTDDARFLSRTFLYAPPRPAYAVDATSRSRSRSRSAFGRQTPDPEGHDYVQYHASAAQLESTRRRERATQGWSGEWSGAAGMADVVKSLRELRVG